MAANDRPSKQVEIGEQRFEIRELPPIVALRLSAKLLPIFGAFASSSKVNPATKEIAIDPSGFASIAAQISPELLEELRSTFAGTCSVLEVDQRTGSEAWPELSNKLVFDRTFGGKIRLLYQWLIECLKLNFSDFLDGLMSVPLENARSGSTGESPPQSPST